jgi:hypothetical protein
MTWKYSTMQNRRRLTASERISNNRIVVAQMKFCIPMIQRNGTSNEYTTPPPPQRRGKTGIEKKGEYLRKKRKRKENGT